MPVRYKTAEQGHGAKINSKHSYVCIASFQPQTRNQPSRREKERDMRFSVKAWSSGARAGILHLDSVTVETPCLLLSTTKGLPHFTSPDLLRHLPASLALHLSPISFWDLPTSQTISSLGGLHSMLGLPDLGMVANPRDSLVCIPQAESCNKHGASFETPFGRRHVKPVQYMETVSALKPDLWVSLSDEIPSGSSKKRNRTSVDRSTQWLDSCLAAQPFCSQPLIDSVLGAVVGGSDLQERRRSASEAAKRNVAGFSISGFGMGEKIEDRPSMLAITTEVLPENKLRHIHGLRGPEEILQCVAAGIDIFASTYPYYLTMKGYAMTFPVHMEEWTSFSETNISSEGYTPSSSIVDLHDKIYRTDISPIIGDCNCYTCKRHTRAYIHHLLNTHEMLAQTLLELHNTHHFLKFFEAVRDSIHKGLFKSFCDWFFRAYEGKLKKTSS